MSPISGFKLMLPSELVKEINSNNYKNGDIVPQKEGYYVEGYSPISISVSRY